MAVKKCLKCGKSLKGNDSCMFCHIVPQVYQKKWSVNDKTVFYFDKELKPISLDDRGHNKYIANNGGNVNNHIGEWDYYILSQQDITDMNNSYEPKELEKFFSTTIENEWKNVYELFCKGNDTNINTSIEQHFWDHQEKIENGQGITGIRAEDFAGVENVFDKLQTFVLLQRYRRYQNVERLIENGILSKINELVKNSSNYGITEENAINLLYGDEFKRQLWLNVLLECRTNRKSILSKFQEVMDTKFSAIAIFAPNDCKFILSDNPVLLNSGGQLCNTIADGLYMPITPNILLLYADLEKWRKDDPEIQLDDMLLVRGTSDFVKYYNRILLENSFHKVGFMDNSISNHVDIDKTVSAKCFNLMMNIK